MHHIQRLSFPSVITLREPTVQELTNRAISPMQKRTRLFIFILLILVQLGNGWR